MIYFLEGYTDNIEKIINSIFPDAIILKNKERGSERIDDFQSNLHLSLLLQRGMLEILEQTKNNKNKFQIFAVGFLFKNETKNLLSNKRQSLYYSSLKTNILLKSFDKRLIYITNDKQHNEECQLNNVLYNRFRRTFNKHDMVSNMEDFILEDFFKKLTEEKT